MRAYVVCGLLMFTSLFGPACAQGEDCRVALAMADGSPTPSNLRLSLFAKQQRILQTRIPASGVVILSSLAAGDYRVQIGDPELRLVSSGALHVEHGAVCGLNMD